MSSYDHSSSHSTLDGLQPLILSANEHDPVNNCRVAVGFGTQNISHSLDQLCVFAKLLLDCSEEININLAWRETTLFDGTNSAPPASEPPVHDYYSRSSSSSNRNNVGPTTLSHAAIPSLNEVWKRFLAIDPRDIVAKAKFHAEQIFARYIAHELRCFGRPMLILRCDASGPLPCESSTVSAENPRCPRGRADLVNWSPISQLPVFVTNCGDALLLLFSRTYFDRLFTGSFVLNDLLGNEVNITGAAKPKTTTNNDEISKNYLESRSFMVDARVHSLINRSRGGPLPPTVNRSPRVIQQMNNPNNPNINRYRPTFVTTKARNIETLDSLVNHRRSRGDASARPNNNNSNNNIQRTTVTDYLYHSYSKNQIPATQRAAESFTSSISSRHRVYSLLPETLKNVTDIMNDPRFADHMYLLATLRAIANSALIAFYRCSESGDLGSEKRTNLLPTLNVVLANRTAKRAKFSMECPWSVAPSSVQPQRTTSGV